MLALGLQGRKRFPGKSSPLNKISSSLPHLLTLAVKGKKTLWLKVKHIDRNQIHQFIC